jgi:DNA-directed RNA polymerase specialized sigma24 family protein
MLDYRLRAADVDDVVQVTWMRLYRQMGAIRELRAYHLADA